MELMTVLLEMELLQEMVLSNGKITLFTEEPFSTDSLMDRESLSFRMERQYEVYLKMEKILKFQMYQREDL